MRRVLSPQAACLVLAAAFMPAARPLFAWAFPHLQRPIYTQDSFATLLALHAALVLASSALATLAGIGLGIAVTRPWGHAFRPMAEALVAVGQTVPPVAVLALAVPAIGYGAAPAIVALALYGVLPVLRNTLAGLDGIPPGIAEAAAGMGLSARQRLTWVELPLARPLILAGIRVCAVVNVGTAAIASTVGVRTLGTPIIVGLNGANTAYVLQGAIVTGLLALTLDSMLADTNLS